MHDDTPRRPTRLHLPPPGPLHTALAGALLVAFLAAALAALVLVH